MHRRFLDTLNTRRARGSTRPAGIFTAPRVKAQATDRSRKQHKAGRSRTKQDKGVKMLHLVGVTLGLFIIVMWFSKGLKEGSRFQKSQTPESTASNNKMKSMSEEDLHLLARILSVGLVDADPNYLHHLKGYRDLQGA